MEEFRVLVFNNSNQFKISDIPNDVKPLIDISNKNIIIDTIDINNTNTRNKPTFKDNIFNDSNKFINDHKNCYDLVIFKKTNNTQYSNINDNWTYLQEKEIKTMDTSNMMNLGLDKPKIDVVSDGHYIKNTIILTRYSVELTKMIKINGSILFYDFLPKILKKYGEIFTPGEIHKYSSKIANICEIIKKSKGIVMIYSQYIDGGIIPMALALESMGFTRYSSTPAHAKPLLKHPKEPIDSLTMKTRSETEHSFKPAKYTIISGDKFFSHDNAADIKYVTKIFLLKDFMRSQMYN
jgi:hypothetical protein